MKIVKYLITVSFLTLGTITQINAQQGIGTPTPTNALHINDTDPLRLEGLQPGVGGEAKLVVDANGVVKTETIVGVGAKFVTLNANSTQTFDATTFNNSAVFEQVNFVSGDIKINTLGATMAGPNVVLNEVGFYEVSGIVYFRPQYGYTILSGAIGINVRLTLAGTNVGGTRNTLTNTNLASSTYATFIELKPTIIEVTTVGSGVGIYISRATGVSVNGGATNPELIRVPIGVSYSKILIIKKL